MINCGWASISEAGTVNGARGDQKQIATDGKKDVFGEVKQGQWYQFGQNVIIEFKDRKKARKAMWAMKAICNSKQVGYSQNDRTSLYSEMSKIGFDYKKIDRIGRCNCDCSALIAVVLKCAGISISKDCWTGNLQSACKATGEFIIRKADKYLINDRYIKLGSIILNESRHVIMALEDGSSALPVWRTNYTMNKRNKPSVLKGSVIAKIPAKAHFRACKYGEDWLDTGTGFVKRVGKTKVYCEKVNK